MKRGHNSGQLPREGLSGPQEVVRLKLLGGFRVTIGDRAIAEAGWRLRKAASLVKLLALAPGRRLHREQVMEALWPDLGRRAASNNLRQILHVARKALDPDSASRYLIYRDGQLLLCPEGSIRLDVEAFEEAAATARRLGEPAAHRAAIDLYAGDLLPADRYEDWAEERRSELRRTFISLLVELASLYEQQREYGPSIETLERAVAGEPLHEEARVALMRVHALAGSSAEALKQYERLENTLYRELGSRPEASSRRLREEIAAGRFPRRETRATSDSLSAKARTHNLPAVRTKLVGREREMLEIKRELALTRLLTLTGVGGSGKTRLALEVARDLTGAYPDGVWLAELAPLSDSSLVPGAVAEALGINERAGQQLVDTLVEAVRPRNTLLVLDNCEHVVEKAARLSDVLLDACPGLRILATSREALGVAGEVRWVVPALTTPGLRRSWSVEELQEYESARLFAERARQRDPSYSLTAARAQPVAQICTRLEGIPLAIELAAARIGTLGTAQISERLEDSIGLLTTTVHTAPRQRTLRGALDWSHELLSADEKKLFGRLAVFAGGWTLEAAEAVGSGGGIDESEVLDLLSGIVDKSLVVTEASGTDGVRYRFLEPVRQYAHARLTEDRKAIRHRHATFFLIVAEEAEPGLRGPDQAAWRERLDADLDNLRAALSWLTENGDAEGCLRLGSALLFYWMWRGSLREGRRWLEEGLDRGAAVTGSVRAKAMNALADIKIQLGEYDRSLALLEESLSLYRAAGDAKGIAACLCDLGWLAAFQREYLRATELLEESIVLSRESGDKLRYAFALNRLAGVAGSRREYDRAESLLEESLELYREAGDIKSMAMSLSMLGYLALRLGDPERAVSRIEESMKHIREVGLTPDAFALTVLALSVMMRGEHERAGDLIVEGLLRGRMTGNRLHTVQCIETAAILATLRAVPKTAAILWGAAEAEREALGAPLDLDDQALFEPHLVAARTGLGDEVWKASWEQGRMMSLEEAVDSVLSEEGATTSAPPTSGSQQDSDPTSVLSRREKEVAVLVADGLTNRQIASQLYISDRTVEHHVARILRKLGLLSREQVAGRLGDN